MRRLLVLPLFMVLGCAADIGAPASDNDPSSEPTDELGTLPPPLHAGCPTTGVTSGGCVTATEWSPPLAGKLAYYPPGATSVQVIATTGHQTLDANGNVIARYVYVWVIKNGDTVQAAYDMLRSDYNAFHVALLNDFDSNPIGSVSAWVQEGGGLNGVPKPSPTPHGIPWYPISFVNTVLTMANQMNVQYANVLAGTNSVDYQVQ